MTVTHPILPYIGKEHILLSKCAKTLMLLPDILSSVLLDTTSLPGEGKVFNSLPEWKGLGWGTSRKTRGTEGRKTGAVQNVFSALSFYDKF